MAFDQGLHCLSLIQQVLETTTNVLNVVKENRVPNSMVRIGTSKKYTEATTLACIEGLFFWEMYFNDEMHM